MATTTTNSPSNPDSCESDADLFPFTLACKSKQGEILQQAISTHQQTELVKNFIARKADFKAQQQAYVAESWLNFIAYQVQAGYFKREQAELLARELKLATKRLTLLEQESANYKPDSEIRISPTPAKANLKSNPSAISLNQTADVNKIFAGSAMDLILKLGLASGYPWLESKTYAELQGKAEAKKEDTPLLASLWQQWLASFAQENNLSKPTKLNSLARNSSLAKQQAALTQQDNPLLSALAAYRQKIEQILCRGQDLCLAPSQENQELVASLLSKQTLFQQTQLGLSLLQKFLKEFKQGNYPQFKATCLSQLETQDADHAEEQEMLAHYRRLVALVQHPRLAAVSGGADSLALSLALLVLGLPIAISHINHGFNPHAQAWQDMVEMIAELGVAPHLTATPLIGVLPSLQSGNTEALARKYRYQNLFARLLAWQQESGATPELLIAHHQDEQAEQLLLNLNRGADSFKLAIGLKDKTSYKVNLPLCEEYKNFILPHPVTCITAWRPLLKFSKAELIGWLADYQVGFAYDKMNFAEQYQRVRYRNLLTDASFNPAQLMSSLELQRQQTSLLQEYLEQELKQVLALAPTSDLSQITSLDLKQLLNYYCSQQDEVSLSKPGRLLSTDYHLETSSHNHNLADRLATRSRERLAADLMTPTHLTKLLNLVNCWLEAQQAPRLTRDQFLALCQKLLDTKFANQLLLSQKLKGISDSLIYYYWQQGLRVYSVSSEYKPLGLQEADSEADLESAPESDHRKREVKDSFEFGRTALSLQGLVVGADYYLISRYPLLDSTTRIKQAFCSDSPSRTDSANSDHEQVRELIASATSEQLGLTQDLTDNDRANKSKEQRSSANSALAWHLYKLEPRFRFSCPVASNKKQRQKLNSVAKLMEFLTQATSQGSESAEAKCHASLKSDKASLGELRESVKVWQQLLHKITGLSPLASGLEWSQISWLELSVPRNRTPELLPSAETKEAQEQNKCLGYAQEKARVCHYLNLSLAGEISPRAISVPCQLDFSLMQIISLEQ